MIKFRQTHFIDHEREIQELYVSLHICMTYNNNKDKTHGSDCHRQMLVAEPNQDY